MSKDDNMITIKLKRGNTEIEITCPEEKVKQTVENVIRGLEPELISNPVAAVDEPVKSISESKTPKPNVICRDLIYSLWHENWFRIEKNLSDVSEELSRNGYHYDKTSISHSLADLVRENVLTRVGAIRNYRYVQKKPPP